jgi:hypothetical protein
LRLCLRKNWRRGPVFLLLSDLTFHWHRLRELVHSLVLGVGEGGLSGCLGCLLS